MSKVPKNRPTPSEPEYEPPRSRRANIIWLSSAALVTVAVIALAFVIAIPQSSPGQPPSGAEQGINSSMASLLQLDSVKSMHINAPDYRLTDQNGNLMTADEFHGRSVVFTVNDDQCKDLCTLLAQDIIAADHDLGPAAKNIAFVSINANPYYPKVKDVADWTKEHHLDKLGNWYFGTADPATLKTDWRRFDVPVELKPNTKDVVHGSEIFFISPNGTEVALGQFGTESADTAPFAHAMAQMAVDMLPASQRTTVKGPVSTASTSGGALGASPTAISLPTLRKPNQFLSTSADTGRYTVLNFWSSTCTACVQELPDLQKAHQMLGSSVDFIGDDVSDITQAGLAFAKKSGVNYPQLNDATGRISGQYRISGLPYTVVLSPKGKVLIRHAGRFTTEQLVYVVQTLQGEGSDSPPPNG